MLKHILSLAAFSLVLLACSRSPAPPPAADATPAPPAPAAAQLQSAATSTASTVAITNETAAELRVFIAFGADSVVLPASIPDCHVDAGLTCAFPLGAHATKDLPLGGRYLNATLAFGMPVGCGATKAELNVNNPKWYDTIDISLVDGFNAPMAIDVASLEDGGSHVLGPVRSAQGNEKAYGVFPYGCDICVERQHPPCGIAPGKEGCKTGTQYKPDVICQYQGGGFGGGSRIVVKRLL